jgi:hypothetical protein
MGVRTVGMTATWEWELVDGSRVLVADDGHILGQVWLSGDRWMAEAENEVWMSCTAEKAMTAVEVFYGLHPMGVAD